YYVSLLTSSLSCLFFFLVTLAPTPIYTLSLHDALPISIATIAIAGIPPFAGFFSKDEILWRAYEANWIFWLVGLVTAFITSFYIDRKSTRLNSSHQIISYAVFCLKKKKYTTHNN